MVNPIGTYLYTWLNGRQVGEDEFGNRYFEHKNNQSLPQNKQKRWVIFKGLIEASKVPPKWRGWLHFACNDVKEYQSYDWQKKHSPNMTGTKYAYKYHTSIDNIDRRVLNNYESWKPE